MIHTNREECGWQYEEDKKFLHTYTSFEFPTSMDLCDMCIICLCYTYLGSRRRQSVDRVN